MKNLFHCSCTKRAADLAPLILRVVTGLIFAMHGYQKLTMMGLPGVSGFLGSLGFPAAGFFAALLIAAELVGGLMLILGAYTHWVAKILAFVSVVAFFTVHITHGFFLAGGGYEYIILLFAAAVSLMITGPGKYSVDHKLKIKN
ncbi:MAG: DoxX family protein [Parcubacteria group bacterium]|nr:DoxX family protein [Parcubacteria group bacterium]